PPAEIIAMLSERAQKSYRRREIEFPVDQMLASVFGPDAQTADSEYGINYVRGWTKSKFDVELMPEQIAGKQIAELRETLIAHQEKAISDASVDAETDRLIAGNPSIEELAKRWTARFGMPIDPRLLDPATAGTLKGKRALLAEKDRPQ